MAALDSVRCLPECHQRLITLARHVIIRAMLSGLLAAARSLARTLLSVVADAGRLLRLKLASSFGKEAKILFLEKQLALFKERLLKPCRAGNATRLSMLLLAKLFDWRDALLIVKPDTLIRWHRNIFKLLWRHRSKPLGRPPVPVEARELIRTMARDNPTWGEDRIANELLLKLGLRLSPRTIAKYMPRLPDGSRQPAGQRWLTFVRNHTRSIVAADFFTAVTAGFSTLYIFIILEIGSRRVLHFNVTATPSPRWVGQQLREAIPCDHSYRFLIHDRDSIFSREVDDIIKGVGLRPLKTPVRAPQANSFVERFGGTLRRECLDYMIPTGEHHLRHILSEWIGHYNSSRPHMSLGPGIPDPPDHLPVKPQQHRHRIPDHCKIVSQPILGGLHHEYRLEKAA